MASHSSSDTISQPECVQPAPSTSRFIEAGGGVRLHYLDYGTAGCPPMLCVHGAAAHAHWYDFVAPAFTADYHVRSLDLRGHGDSAWSESLDYSHERFAADLAEVVEKLDLRDFVLVGHSMGGMVSLIYASTYPGRVSKLVIVDARPRLTEEFISQLREFSSREASSYATRDELVERYRLRPTGSHAASQIIRHVAQHSARQANDGSWQHKFDRRIHVKRELVDGLACWSKISIPALLVTGALSQRINPQIFAQIKACCPHIELAEVANSDHHVTLDNPRGFTDAVRSFLAQS